MERFVIPSSLIRTHPNESVLLMRLGALANAVLSVASMSAGALATGVGEDRDALQSTLIMVSYLKEAIDVINAPRSWELIEAGVNAGYPLPKPIEVAKEVFSRSRGSLYKTIVFDIRRRKGFHVDEGHFQEWLKGLMAEEVTVWRKDSNAPLDWAFTAAAQIQSFFGPSLNDAQFDALENVVLLPHLVAAMTIGLMAQAGIDPRAGMRRQSVRRVNIEFNFNDGRPDFGRTFRLVVDDNGDINSAANVLRDLVTEIFGGQRVGATIPGPSADIAFFSQHGSAQGWLAGKLPPAPITATPVRILMMRAGQMANWGSLRTKKMLAYVHAVRTGAASTADTERMFQELLSERDFWREREQEIDEISRLARKTQAL